MDGLAYPLAIVVAVCLILLWLRDQKKTATRRYSVYDRHIDTITYTPKDKVS